MKKYKLQKISTIVESRQVVFQFEVFMVEENFVFNPESPKRERINKTRGTIKPVERAF